MNKESVDKLREHLPFPVRFWVSPVRTTVLHAVRTLATNLPPSVLWLNQVCADYCAEESPDNRYYATQYGEECWCAPSVDLRHGEGTCEYACAGAAETTCGGYEAFDLFELGAVVNPPAEDYYVGCFADDQQDRVLDDMMSSDGMTLQVSALSPRRLFEHHKSRTLAGNLPRG